MVEVFAHSVSSWSSCEFSEGNDSFVFENSLHVLDGLQQVESLTGLGGLVRVFEMTSQVVNSAFSSYRK